MEKQLDKYLRSVRRRLNMPKDLKDRVMTDFTGSLEVRLESGQSFEEILAELGSHKQAAKELNAQMMDYTYQKSPWRWGCLLLAIVSGLCMAYRGLPGLLLMLFNKVNNAASVGIIGGADGPTAIFVTTAPTDKITPSFGMYTLLFTMGVIGFIALGRLKKK